MTGTLHAGRRGKRASRGTMLRKVTGVAGEIMITLGVIVLLFLGYELWFTGFYTEGVQADFKKQLQMQWSKPLPPQPQLPGESPSATSVPEPVFVDKPMPGDAIGIIRIPRLGTNYAYAIVQGVSVADLKKGPGHYPGTAMPGEIGNFVVSGHRTTYLAPFNGLGELTKGDAIVIETRDTWYTYRVTGTETVLPTAMDVILPVPHQPNTHPTQRLITLTTCTPKFSASHRLVVYGQLESALARSDGPPPALQAVAAG